MPVPRHDREGTAPRPGWTGLYTSPHLVDVTERIRLDERDARGPSRGGAADRRKPRRRPSRPARPPRGLAPCGRAPARRHRPGGRGRRPPEVGISVEGVDVEDAHVVPGPRQARRDRDEAGRLVPQEALSVGRGARVEDDAHPGLLRGRAPSSGSGRALALPTIEDTSPAPVSRGGGGAPSCQAGPPPATWSVSTSGRRKPPGGSSHSWPTSRSSRKSSSWTRAQGCP